MKLLIIGGGAGGPAAASRARRLDEDSEIVIFERGEHVSYGHCGLPYFVGGVIQDRSELLIATPKLFKDRYNVDARVRSVVKDIMPEEKQIEVVDLNTGDGYRESYDKMILSTGANPIKPPLPGIDTEGIFTLRNLTDADKINQFIAERKPKKAVVVGGGFIGLEMAENFKHLGMDVTIVEMLDQVMPPLDREMADVIHQTLMLHKVELALSDPVAGFEQQGNQIIVKQKSGGEISCDIVILSIGVRPNLELAKSAELEIGEIGGIKVDDHMQTSNSDIYAVGDAIETTNFITGKAALVPLAGIAARQSRIAINNIYGREDKYRGTLGTSLVKVFEVAVGSVGVNEKTLKKLGMEYEKCYLHPFSHVTYFPDAAQMNMKLLFSPDGKKIYGAQILGTEGIDKRIDSLATAISAGMSVEDLTHLELGYVPSYGSAKEVLNYAGYIASNMINGDAPTAHWDDLDELVEGDGVFLDTRPKEIAETGMVPGAINIPVNELRGRLNELPKDVPIYVYCRVGLQSYISARMLRQNGFNAINMSGGYGAYRSLCLCGENIPESVERLDDKPATFAEKTLSQSSETVQLDACGLQCPGPIMKVKEKMDELQAGSVLEVMASDAGFAADLPAWCRTAGHDMLSIESRDGKIVGVIRKCDADAEETVIQGPAVATGAKEKTVVVFSNDFDRVMSTFIIANGSAAMGYKVNLFFTFWGLNVLRKNYKVRVRKSFMDKMFGWMMPRGASKLKLSKMNMGGMGTRMMQGTMRKKNVHSLQELIDAAREQGVRLIACTMTMDIMGIKKEELIDGIEEGGVAAFLEDADHSNMTLFI